MADAMMALIMYSIEYKPIRNYLAMHRRDSPLSTMHDLPGVFMHNANADPCGRPGRHISCRALSVACNAEQFPGVTAIAPTISKWFASRNEFGTHSGPVSQ
jgi:hypothetical protein